ncbi:MULTISPECIES: DUF2145 domain-containing protein [unclassified Undibacterium]|uniref:DUF2145 domain-containing protein n=1 Tax=unclassified Undibacterium TaxID=2630295 RepID=UPI002AC91FF0|nr:MULTISPECIES: DUF2145 domain-containing protein [unclassified Undibacterium]MEB0139592.1 DUF2145 domain-containing protein [Undibacterium sp. CCC2.1]MEB0172477.1 DUF2145 domain-containing protein [Undibacterium sp. CCC1.1]MEB0176495.1 DUF2145 domain-containing protein [Undibacterium sp. CCC3.4]WPX43953.1 DUF2145 domain-containing protein [Undibacterium sp. CCC3.4]
MMRRFCRTLVLLWLCQSGLAQAGRACDSPPQDARKIMQALEFAQKTSQRLDASQAELVLLARVGQDLSAYHVRYSHLAFARKQQDGRWLITHELNQCGTAASDLFNEGVGNFFLDDVFAYEALILIPPPALQQQIAQALSNGNARRLHDPHYNMLAYPFAADYQNSNQWILEVLAAASASDLHINRRDMAQAWLKAAGYTPDTLHIDAATRLGARLFRANISFADQPFNRRMAGQIDTVTVESIQRFLLAREPATQKIVLNQ